MRGHIVHARFTPTSAWPAVDGHAGHGHVEQFRTIGTADEDAARAAFHAGTSHPSVEILSITPA